MASAEEKSDPYLGGGQAIQGTLEVARRIDGRLATLLKHGEAEAAVRRALSGEDVSRQHDRRGERPPRYTTQGMVDKYDCAQKRLCLECVAVSAADRRRQRHVLTLASTNIIAASVNKSMRRRP